MITLKDLLPHISEVIGTVIFFDKNEEREYMFDLDDELFNSSWYESVLIDWKILEHLGSYYLYVTNWK